MLDGGGAVELGVGGALIGGEGVGDREAVGDGGGREVEVHGRGSPGGGGGIGCTYRRDAPGVPARLVNQSVRTDYRVQNAVVRLYYHRRGEGIMRGW